MVPKTTVRNMTDIIANSTATMPPVAIKYLQNAIFIYPAGSRFRLREGERDELPGMGVGLIFFMLFTVSIADGNSLLK